jgi:glyoxylase-like metal-dependent hydrolase (beta-lactamase superfamily II)
MNVNTLETGFLWINSDSMFCSMPKPLWSKSHPADERNRIRLAMRCLLLEGEGRRVLVDDGVGDKFPPKLVDIYRVESGVHSLERALAGLGLKPDDVTDVLLTHLHFDHAAGSTRVVDGRLRPTFARARYWVQRKNYENAAAPNPRERASYMPENFEPLREAGVLELLEGPQSPFPGVELIPADGHTRGQQLVRVHGGGQALYFLADLIPTRSHVRVPFVMGYDVCAIQTMDEKKALLGRAIDEGAWVCLEHDPEIALARPARDGDDFTWSETVPAEGAAATPGAPPEGGAR